MRENSSTEGIDSLNAVCVHVAKPIHRFSLFIGLLPSFAPYILIYCSFILMYSLLFHYNISLP